MDFYEVVDKVVDLLRRRGRLTYSSLKIQFQLDDTQVEALREEILYAHESSVQADDRGFIWIGDGGTDSATETPLTPSPPEPTTLSTPDQEREPLSYTPPHLAEKILQSKAALEGERKQVTVLFCDLANSSAIANEIGAENMHGLLNRFFELALSEVHRYEGMINQFLGDGFMALFGAPLSLEDHAHRGVLAAIALQRSLKDAELGKPYGMECAFRMGLNSGLVVVGSIGDNLRMDYSAIGDTTNLAARLQGIAEPGEILVSEATGRLVQGYVRLEALQPVQVKGKTEPVATYKVVGTLSRRSPIASRSERTLSQFVGRERELAVLDELFEQAKSGSGQIVGVVAEAGAGKSRLLYEFRQRLQDKQVTYLEGRCLSYGSSIPYHPIIDVVRNNCGVTEADSPETIVEKVRSALQEACMDADTSAPYLLQLLGVKEGTESIAMLTPEAVRTRTFETLKQMSLKESQQQPLVFEIEDLHWIDNSSQDYLATLVENLPGASILLLTTYRPGYQPSWLGKSYATQISLHHLTPHDGLTLVHSALHGETLPDQVEQMIIDKAEGNPFFLEELTRAMIEQGGSVADIDVPNTVQGVLMARIDRLPEETKRLLQTASVLGREFSPTVLKAIWEGTDKLEPWLLELKRLEFLFERSGTEEPIYVFKHALTQDVAYESLLTNRRQTLHEAAGQALEDLYADHLEDAYDRLAYHYARTDNAVKAVEYLTRVAGKAAGGYAHAEAVTMLQEALVHAERLPDAERDQSMLTLVIRQSESLHVLARRREAVALLVQHQQRLEWLQDPFLTSQYHASLGMLYSFLGERDKATQHSSCAFEAARHSRDVATMSRMLFQLTLEETFAGQLRQAVEHSREMVTLWEETEGHEGLRMAYYRLGWSSYFMGDFVQGLAVLVQAEALATTHGDRRTQTNAGAIRGWTLATQGEWEAGVAACQRALRDSPTAFETAMVLGMLGYAYLEQGDLVQAIPVLEEAVQQATQYRSQQIQSWYRTYLGEAYHVDGQVEKARDLACQGLHLAQNAEHPWGAALAQHTLGRIAATSGNLPEATTYLREALATFDAIQSRYELARTHLDIASLAHTHGDQDTATMHLSTAYTWFKKLQVPKWIEKTEQLAREYGVTLTEVESEELTEGSS